MDCFQIALADDHRLFRRGIVALIERLPRYNVLFEAGEGEELISKISANVKPDILLLDLNMPKMDGISTAIWLHEHYPEIKIIVLSMHNDADKVLTMIRLGVKGYLLKDAQPHEFEEALDTVANSETYFPAFVTNYLVNNISQENNANAKLNGREREFLKLAVTELTYKEIAKKMSVSLRTVDGYRDQLFEKLDVKSRVGLVIYALKKKLIEL